MRARILLLASTSMVVASLLAPRAATAQTAPVPRFEAASCPFKVDPSLTEGKDVRCGYLIVPENRSVANGKTIKLAVEIVKSASDHPAADPVFFLDGGPGGSALMDLGQYVNASNRDFLAGDRDLVLIDQRGTGYSQPNLRCQEAERMGQQIETKRVSLQQEATLEVQAAAQCRARLVNVGFVRMARLSSLG
jgi:pimeloyl-ACP methyl ester carboxylesterase